jgi:hypothetical protein
MSLLDPECTVMQIKTLSNEKKVDEIKLTTNDNYVKLRGKEE